MRPRLEQRACPCGGRDGRLPSRKPPVAGAEPDFSCAGELEQPLKALIGKVCRPPVGRSVAWSVARSVLVELSISCGGVLCLGSSAGAGALGFPAPGYWILWASRLCSRLVFCHGRCMCVPVGTTPSSSCASLLVSRSLRLSRLGSRAGIAIAGGSTRLLAVITRVPPRLAVRCALFSVFVGVGRFSGDNKIGRLFGGASLSGFAFGLRLRASPSGFAFGLRLRASPSGPPEATTRLRTHGRCPGGSFPDWRVWGRWVADLARKILLGFLSSPHCGELRKPSRSYERCPQPIDPQVPPLRLCGDVSAGSSAKPARERGLSLDPYRSRTPVRCFVAPCLMPFDAKIRPLIPSLSFPPQLTKVLPAQVARSARRRSTSRLHERARHVWRRGIVKRLLRYRLEGHFRSQSFISRILIDATP